MKVKKGYKEKAAERERQLAPIFTALKALHKKHGLDLLRSGCNRYLNILREKAKAESKIQELEASLVELRSKAKMP